MPIKNSAIAPVKKFLVDVDPSEDTWVMIKPITFRDDIARGELLKQRETYNTSTPGVMASKGLNMYRLRAEELWLTYDDAHIVLEDSDSSLFKPRSEMTRNEFLQVLGSLPPAVILSWYSKMLEVNPDWAFPF